MSLAGFVLFALLAQATPAASNGAVPPSGEHARPGAPSWSELEATAAGRDTGALARVAARIGLARIGAALRAAADEPQASSRTRVALAAVPLLDGRLALLPALAPLLAHPDDALAALVVAAVTPLLDGADPAAYESWEIPAGTLAEACRLLGGLAAERRRSADVRVGALRALVAAASVCASTARDPALLADDLAEVRRTAVAAATPAQRRALVERLSDDDARVASAAAARLCQLTRGSDGDAIVGDAVMAAAERFVGASGAVAADVVDLVECVASGSDPGRADARRRVLERAAKSPLAPVRKRAKDLLDARR